MKLCITLVVIGILGAFSGPQTVSGHIAEIAKKLTAAIYDDNAQIVEKLIQRGANVNHIALDGRSALEKARGKAEIEELLRKHGAH